MNEITATVPKVEAVFHVERHPDPLARLLIAEIERLREENERLKAQLYEAGKAP